MLITVKWLLYCILPLRNEQTVATFKQTLRKRTKKKVKMFKSQPEPGSTDLKLVSSGPTN